MRLQPAPTGHRGVRHHRAQSLLLLFGLSHDGKLISRFQIRMKRAGGSSAPSKEGRPRGLGQDPGTVGRVAESPGGCPWAQAPPPPAPHPESWRASQGLPGSHSPRVMGAAGVTVPRAACPGGAGRGSHIRKQWTRGRRRGGARGGERDPLFPTSLPPALSDVCGVSWSRDEAQSDSVTHLQMCGGPAGE